MALVFFDVTVKPTVRHPCAASASMDLRSSAYPMPLPRRDGATQICVMCPVSLATRLASEMPHSSPFTPLEATAANEAGAKKVPHPGYCTMLLKNRRDPLGE